MAGLEALLLVLAGTTTRRNTHHGLLLVNNDDIVAPGTGFETHPHQDMEIVTWVLTGSLVHQDSTGHSGVIYPGLAQRMSAGTGILHSEKNDSWRLQGGAAHHEPVHFVQMWVLPDEDGITPGLRAAGDRRRAAARRAGAGRLRDGQARRRSGDPDQEQARRPVRRAAGSGRDGRAAARRRSCTCSWPAARCRSRMPVRSPRATPCGSRRPAASTSPRASRPRSSSGRCTRRSAARDPRAHGEGRYTTVHRPSFVPGSLRAEDPQTSGLDMASARRSVLRLGGTHLAHPVLPPARGLQIRRRYAPSTLIAASRTCGRVS